MRVLLADVRNGLAEAVEEVFFLVRRGIRINLLEEGAGVKGRRRRLRLIGVGGEGEVGLVVERVPDLPEVGVEEGHDPCLPEEGEGEVLPDKLVEEERDMLALEAVARGNLFQLLHEGLPLRLEDPKMRGVGSGVDLEEEVDEGREGWASCPAKMGGCGLLGGPDIKGGLLARLCRSAREDPREHRVLQVPKGLDEKVLFPDPKMDRERGRVRMGLVREPEGREMLKAAVRLDEGGLPLGQI